MTYQDLAELITLLQPYPAEKMVAYAVAPLSNSPKHNSIDLIRPVA
jgi:putative SOS response-associated peptidase YedK